MDVLIGRVLDDTYRIDELLGQGGMGAVYKGHDVALDRDVAIKVMHAHISSQPGFRDRFLQEARAIANVSHPGIVQVHAFSRDPQLLYIVMAFVPGSNLQDWQTLLAERSALVTLTESLALVETVANALAYAHGRGVYHRDIKPGNIILRPLEPGETSDVGLSFAPVVTDFGLARLAEGGAHGATGISLGTPAYVSPEQCEGEPTDGRSDLYSLGVVLYELSTGRVPFPAKTLTEAIRARALEPVPPRSISGEISPRVEEIILTALRRPPEERYQSAEEMAQALRQAREAEQHDVELGEEDATPEGRVSLATLVSEEMPIATPSADAWPTPPSDVTMGAQVVILGPSTDPARIPFADRRQLTIGRGSSNDIVLRERRASRRHAQITVEGDDYFVTDLNSTNGTYLGGERLVPGAVQPWPADVPARIGRHWLRLETPDATAVPRSIASTVVADRDPASLSLVGIAIEPRTLSVRPGDGVELTILVSNRQRFADRFAISVEQLPSLWLTVPTDDLHLAAGELGEVILQIQPPGTASVSGRRSFVVRVVSRANPGHTAQAQGTLEIEPPPGIAVELWPKSLTEAGRGTIRLTNRGGATEVVTLTASDPSKRLDIQLETSRITLGGEQTREVGFGIEPLGSAPSGRTRSVPFAVVATTADGTTYSERGTYELRPPPEPAAPEPYRFIPPPPPDPEWENDVAPPRRRPLGCVLLLIAVVAAVALAAIVALDIDVPAVRSVRNLLRGSTATVTAQPEGTRVPTMSAKVAAQAAETRAAETASAERKTAVQEVLLVKNTAEAMEMTRTAEPVMTASELERLAARQTIATFLTRQVEETAAVEATAIALATQRVQQTADALATSVAKKTADVMGTAMAEEMARVQQTVNAMATQNVMATATAQGTVNAQSTENALAAQRAQQTAAAKATSDTRTTQTAYAISTQRYYLDERGVRDIPTGQPVVKGQVYDRDGNLITGGRARVGVEVNDNYWQTNEFPNPFPTNADGWYEFYVGSDQKIRIVKLFVDDKEVPLENTIITWQSARRQWWHVDIRHR